MTILDPSAGYFALINTFAVEPSKTQAVLAHLSKATEDVFLRIPGPGFISANLPLCPER